jgi:hypothetical protein
MPFKHIKKGEAMVLKLEAVDKTIEHLVEVVCRCRPSPGCHGRSANSAPEFVRDFIGKSCRARRCFNGQLYAD